jgi:hypothetical protein
LGFSVGTALFLTLFAYGGQPAVDAPPPLVVITTGNGLAARVTF